MIDVKRLGQITYNVRDLCKCGIRIPSTYNHCLAFDEDKYFEPMFGDVGQAGIKAWMCTAAHCFNVELQLHKTFVLAVRCSSCQMWSGNFAASFGNIFFKSSLSSAHSFPVVSICSLNG